MKIKFKKTVTEVEEVDVELPIYRKDICHYYRVFSEDHCVKVCTLKEWEEISVNPFSNAFSGNTSEDCTSEEFYKALTTVTELLQSKTF